MISSLLLVTLVAVYQLPFVFSFSSPNSLSVSSLIETHSEKISSLKNVVQKFDGDAPSDDMFYLRYCLGNESTSESLERIEATMKWRNGKGKTICDSAKSAVDSAVANPSSWDNNLIRDLAPYATTVNEYISTEQCIAVSTRRGDLCYCIRAGKIDDVTLMSKITLEQMTDYFLYCREVNALVANMRSLKTDRVVNLLTANDLTGVKLIGGDASFRQALSAASKISNDLYPNLTGPTLLLNLPRLLGALVKLFTPLFPSEVRKKLKFVRGPLKDIDDLIHIAPGGKAREEFLNELDQIVYND